MKLYLLVWTFMVAFNLILAKSVQKLTDTSIETSKRQGKVWEPPSGSRDDWMQYHGMSRDEWEKIINTLRDIDTMQNGRAIAAPLQQGSTPGNRVEEGCMWYTNEQVEEALDEMLGAVSPNEETLQWNNDPQTLNTDQSSQESKTDLVSEVDGTFETQIVHRRQKRKIENMEKRPERKWHNPIFYKFDGSHTEKEQDIIRAAVDHWQKHTCMRFFEVNANAPIGQQHLLFTSENYGCYSFVGKTTQIPQQINLASICLGQFGIPVHEIGHALGLWHEQQRKDRDDWIQVNKDNIGYYSSQFWRRNTVSHGVPYDYGSVMHYASTAGSKNRQRTMDATDPLYTMSMGQRVEMSYFDAKIINLEYCQDSCSNILPHSCEKGGYQDPTDCHSCVCPEGYGGRYCQVSAQSVHAECGGDIEVGYDAVTIQSPGYDNPGYYEDFTECNWIIKAPENHTVQLTFKDEFAVYCHKLETCFHWVEIKYKQDFEYPGPRFCCYDLAVQNLTSETNEMAVIFKSNFPTEFSTARKGFRASLVAIPPEGYEKPEINEKENTESTTPRTTTTTEPPGTHWGEWSGCGNHECKCGGCGSESRKRMCGEKICIDDLAGEQTRHCDRLCTQKDTFLQYTGKFVRIPCPVCCKGFQPNEDKCIPST